MPANADQSLARRALIATVMSGALALAVPAHAEVKGLEIIAPAGPGGGYDQLARSTPGGAPGQAAGGGRAGPEHPRRRWHHRARPVCHQGLAQPEPARGGARHDRRDRDQQVTGHARTSAAAGAAHRGVSAPGGRSGFADQVGQRSAGAVQGRPRLGELGRVRFGLPRPHPVRADREGGRRGCRRR